MDEFTRRLSEQDAKDAWRRQENQKVSKEEKLLNELNKIKDWVKKIFNNKKKKKGKKKNGKQRSQHKH